MNVKYNKMANLYEKKKQSQRQGRTRTNIKPNMCNTFFCAELMNKIFLVIMYT